MISGRIEIIDEISAHDPSETFGGEPSPNAAAASSAA